MEVVIPSACMAEHIPEKGFYKASCGIAKVDITCEPIILIKKFS